MGGAAFATLFLTTATILGIDVLIYNWTEFLVLMLLLVIALFIGRVTVNKSHRENFDSDFMMAGTALVELSLLGMLIVYIFNNYLGFDLLELIHGYECMVRVISILLTMLIGYKIGQIEDDVPIDA